MGIDTIIQIGGAGFYETYLADSSKEDVYAMGDRLEAESSAAHKEGIGEEWGDTRQQVDVQIVTEFDSDQHESIEDAVLDLAGVYTKRRAFHPIRTLEEFNDAVERLAGPGDFEHGEMVESGAEG